MAFSICYNMLPDIRETITSLIGKNSSLFPTPGEPIGFQWFGLRQADYTRKCSCIGGRGTSEDPTCVRCFSTGYLFTDFIVRGYLWLGVLGVEYGTKPGLLSTQVRNLVLEHNRPISKFDFVLELDQDPDTGRLRQPLRIIKQYRVQDAAPIKGDKARVEFWRCAVEERNVEDGKPGPDGTQYQYEGNRSNSEPE